MYIRSQPLVKQITCKSNISLDAKYEIYFHVKNFLLTKFFNQFLIQNIFEIN